MEQEFETYKLKVNRLFEQPRFIILSQEKDMDERKKTEMTLNIIKAVVVRFIKTILIKNKKWETSFERAKLICEVTGRNKIFNIKFSYKGNDVTIRTSNLDNTFRYLENIFNNSIVEELPIENKMVI